MKGSPQTVHLPASTRGSKPKPAELEHSDSFEAFFQGRHQAPADGQEADFGGHASPSHTVSNRDDDDENEGGSLLG